jgi:hypothetical protein
MAMQTPNMPSWQQRHSGVQFDANGQPVQPQYDPRAAGITDFGQAWAGAGKFFQTPQFQAWLKAYNDPSRPLTVADQQGDTSSLYQRNY